MTKEILQNYKICVLDEYGLPKYYLLFLIKNENIKDVFSQSEKQRWFSKVEWDYIEEKNYKIIYLFVILFKSIQMILYKSSRKK